MATAQLKAEELRLHIGKLHSILTASNEAAAVLPAERALMFEDATDAAVVKESAAEAMDAATNPLTHIHVPQPDNARPPTQHKQRSPRQLAILLLYSALQQKSYFGLHSETLTGSLGADRVSRLQKELVVCVDAAMAAAVAAGTPVDVPQLMEWLEPLLYRCVFEHGIHHTCLNVNYVLSCNKTTDFKISRYVCMFTSAFAA